jgi:uncharacterized protein (TIGR00725 family)
VTVAEPPAYVAVVGPGDASEGSREYDLARDVGRLLARQRAVVVCGGLGGIMEAAARGASEAGGISVGILPGADRHVANGYLTVAVASGLGELRNGAVAQASDAMIAVGGSWGTLSEVALAVRLGKPVIALRSWTVADASGAAIGGVSPAGSAEEAVAHALMAAG